ncbi:MAG: PAS domain-containing protein, partial [Candidatus Hydrothermarchaeaceae archaeon]
MTAKNLAKAKKKSRKRRKSGGKYRGLIEKSLVGVYIIQDGVFKFANKRFLDILGGKEKDIIGVEYKKFTAPESMDDVVKGVSKRERGKGGPKHYTFKALKKDGTLIDMEVFSVPGIYEGRPAIQGMALDITERKRIEEELRKSEARYKTLVEEMMEGLWVSDKNDRTVYWNKSLERMLGYKLDEVVGKPIHYFTTDENRKVLKRELAKRRTKAPSIYELEYTSKSGKPVSVIVSGAPTFDEDGNFSGSFAVITDVSDRKKMMKELISYTKQLQRSNTLKDLFADIMHH